MSDEQVVLVDVNDQELGTLEKMEAHRKGLLHRAFSVFVFNSYGELMLHRRAENKYHSGGLWTNTCCSHPRPGEDLFLATHRRLQEEMGFDCELEKAFHFIYKSHLDQSLIEHEFDHVFFGAFDGAPEPNQDEVADWKYMSLQDLRFDINANPKSYTEWFKICFERVALHSLNSSK